MPPRSGLQSSEFGETEEGERISGEHRIDGATGRDEVETGRELWRLKIDAALASLRREEELSRGKISQRYPVRGKEPAAE